MTVRTWCRGGAGADLLIRGARAVDPLAGLDQVVDVLVRKGRIAELGDGLPDTFRQARIYRRNLVYRARHRRGGYFRSPGNVTDVHSKCSASVTIIYHSIRYLKPF